MRRIAASLALGRAALIAATSPQVEWFLGSAGASCSRVCAGHTALGAVGCHAASLDNLTLEGFGDVLERVVVGPPSGLCASVGEGGACYDPSYDSGRCGWQSCSYMGSSALCDTTPVDTARRFCPCEMREERVAATLGGAAAEDASSTTSGELLQELEGTSSGSSSSSQGEAESSQKASPPTSVDDMTDQQRQQLIGGVVGGTVGVVTVGLLGGLLGGLLTTSTTGLPIAPPTTTSLRATVTSLRATTATTTTSGNFMPVERALGSQAAQWGAWLDGSASNITGAVGLGGAGKDMITSDAGWAWWAVVAAALLCCVAFAVLFALGNGRGGKRGRESRGVAMSECSDEERDWPQSPSMGDSPSSGGSPWPTSRTALLRDSSEPTEFKDVGVLPDHRAMGGGDKLLSTQRLRMMRPSGLPKLQPLQKSSPQQRGGASSPPHSPVSIRQCQVPRFTTGMALVAPVPVAQPAPGVRGHFRGVPY